MYIHIYLLLDQLNANWFAFLFIYSTAIVAHALFTIGTISSMRRLDIHSVPSDNFIFWNKYAI